MIVEEMDTGKMANVSSLARFVYDDLLDGRFASAWFLLGLATRMARAMRIDADPNFSSMIWADQEARRRVMWSLFCLDSLLSDGSPNNTLFGHDDLINLQLPCTERNFLLQIPCQTEHLGDGMDGEVRETFGQGLREKGGLISHYVKIMNLRRAILRYDKQAHLQLDKPWDSTSAFNAILGRLRMWLESLPPELQMSTVTLQTRHASSQLSAFVALHAWYRQCHFDLFETGICQAEMNSQFNVVQETWVAWARSEAVTYAEAMSDMLVKTDDLFEDFLFLDPSLALIAHDSIRIQVEAMTTSLDSSRTRDILDKMRTVLKVVERMERIFPMVRIITPSMRDMLSRRTDSPILQSGPLPFTSRNPDKPSTWRGSQTGAMPPIRCKDFFVQQMWLKAKDNPFSRDIERSEAVTNEWLRSLTSNVSGFADPTAGRPAGRGEHSPHHVSTVGGSSNGLIPLEGLHSTNTQIDEDLFDASTWTIPTRAGSPLNGLDATDFDHWWMTVGQFGVALDVPSGQKNTGSST